VTMTMTTTTARASLRALARHLGCSHAALSKKVHTGLLTAGVALDARGRVVVTDFDAAAAEWSSIHVPSVAEMMRGSPAHASAAPMPPPPDFFADLSKQDLLERWVAETRHRIPAWRSGRRCRLMEHGRRLVKHGRRCVADRRQFVSDLRQLVASRRDLVEHRRRLVEHWRRLGLRPSDLRGLGACADPTQPRHPKARRTGNVPRSSYSLLVHRSAKRAHHIVCALQPGPEAI
jgi:hypothetical protein